MAKKKKTKKQKRKERLRKAKAWVATYKGTDIAEDYAKRFNVGSVCAEKDLEAMQAFTPEQRKLLKQTHEIRKQKEREEKATRLMKKMEKRKIAYEAKSKDPDPRAMQKALKDDKAANPTKKKPKRRCENCDRVMKQQFIGLKHCKCGTSWSKADGYFERTPDMIFALERKVTKKGKNSIRTKQVPVIRFKDD
jgi:hypothetical protein